MSDYTPTTDEEFDRWIAQHDARIRAEVLREFVKDGVCLSCGDGVLNSGEHIDPERHEAEEHRIRAEVINWIEERPADGWQHNIAEDARAHFGIEKGAIWQRSQPVQVTRGAIVDAIASVTDRWPEPLAEDEISEITTAVRAALRAALGGDTDD